MLLETVNNFTQCGHTQRKQHPRNLAVRQTSRPEPGLVSDAMTFRELGTSRTRHWRGTIALGFVVSVFHIIREGLVPHFDRSGKSFVVSIRDALGHSLAQVLPCFRRGAKRPAVSRGEC